MKQHQSPVGLWNSLAKAWPENWSDSLEPLYELTVANDLAHGGAIYLQLASVNLEHVATFAVHHHLRSQIDSDLTRTSLRSSAWKSAKPNCLTKPTAMPMN